MKHTSSLLISVLAALALPVFAQTAPAKDPAATPGIDKRQAEQQKRIDQGVQSGQLTSKEAARLEKGQERVQAMEDKAKADGKVTKPRSAPASSRRRTSRVAMWPRKSTTASTTATMMASGIARAASKSRRTSRKPASARAFLCPPERADGIQRYVRPRGRTVSRGMSAREGGRYPEESSSIA
jgi:hypothetical protein